ncbi:MAG TPA: hypothetical protein VLF68_03700 [Candidatus Saccharimonadales bacterium]|nr:hypothetical protein [Candidatus Saccharimonadales bacterium]
MRRLSRTITVSISHRSDRFIVWLVGAATFFFGFAAGALLNIYLILTNSPLVRELRSSLSYKSAIFGDGIILPVVNMLAASFLLKNKHLINKKVLTIAALIGLSITIYFHVSQAVEGLVNWAMPSPWHWNALGVWHALYMFSVATLLSLYYIVLFRAMKRRHISPEFALVTLGIIIFFFLLRIDYVSVQLSSLVPQRIDDAVSFLTALPRQLL